MPQGDIHYSQLISINACVTKKSYAEQLVLHSAFFEVHTAQWVVPATWVPHTSFFSVRLRWEFSYREESEVTAAATEAHNE